MWGAATGLWNSIFSQVVPQPPIGQSPRSPCLQVVNGMPDLATVGASCCGLTKLSLWGEAPTPPPGQKSPRTFRSLSCSLGAHVSQLLNLQVCA